MFANSFYHRASIISNESYDEDEEISGEKQSPIDIRKEYIDHDPTMKTSRLKFSYTLGDAKTIEVLKNGFSCKMSEKGTSTLTASHLPDTYRFREFHGHWGDTEEDGSEHRLNGRAFSGELHFMCWNPKYGTYTEALKKADGVAILAVFVLADEKDNEDFQPLLTALEQSMAEDEPVDFPEDFDFARLLPGVLHYFTYEGSLTVPPFPECAIWNVFQRPIPIGEAQLSVLRTIIGDNARALQDVCGRRVRSSFKAMHEKN